MKIRAWGALAVAAVVSVPVLAHWRGGVQGKPVFTEQAQTREIQASILTSGTMVYEHQALLSPEIIGRVQRVLVREGDRVEKGQILLQLDDETLRAEVQQQQAVVAQQRTAVERQQVELAAARRQARRMDQLFDARLIDARMHEQENQAAQVAGITLQSAREQLRQSMAQLEQVQQRQAKATVRAPMSGVVVALAIKEGETAVPSASGIAGSSLLTIADPATLITEVNVDEADIPRVQVGQQAAVFAAGDPDAAVRAEVVHIALTPRVPTPGVPVTGRNYTVRLRFEADSRLTLRPGMSCRAEIYTVTAADALAVPLQAVLSSNSETADPGSREAGQSYVYVSEGNLALRRVVTTGLSDDRYQQIRSGLAVGDRVIVGPYRELRHLRNGDPLRVPEEPRQ
ncbi:efflux RND transporter periplasmic adaptor subunit [Stenotrophomonas sp. JAI102]|uniref:efflux RND transporter periplasmic adaptor subunit n=1 Tax=Stenotrophomonas sp. JAI102 TaxID=2723077 RepID=UPI0015CC46D0|nr:efflux RND transporter periplasmic adaptor subunit [Stenotrophomonas sp. JAI102]NYF35940.1 HlyD family secretion protein [Stenotrophomonas sp. JAI102]